MGFGTTKDSPPPQSEAIQGFVREQKEIYDQLVAEGFTSEQAIQIVVAVLRRHKIVQYVEETVAP